jgi:hypothetical protein
MRGMGRGGGNLNRSPGDDVDDGGLRMQPGQLRGRRASKSALACRPVFATGQLSALEVVIETSTSSFFAACSSWPRSFCFCIANSTAALSANGKPPRCDDTRLFLG